MLYFSTLLKTDPAYYAPAAERLFAALTAHGVDYHLLDGAKDIWLRDFMPVRTRASRYVSFRYEPGYLKDDPALRTDYAGQIAPRFPLEDLVYSDINLDGGNVVFSPSRQTAVISDRVFLENRGYSSAELVRGLERLLQARVVIIPSLRSDMTGHADGMVHFISETAAVGNRSRSLYGLEAKIRATLRDHGIEVCDMPYFGSRGGSAAGCYLNFLETEQALFLPVFGADMDGEAVETAKALFHKTVVPVNVNEIAIQGGVLNCISWED